MFLPGRSRRLLMISALLLPIAATIVWMVGPWNASHPQEEFHRTLVALGQGDLPEVEAGIRRLSRLPDYQSHARLLRGGLLVRRGSHQSALEELANVESQGELRRPAALLTAECLYRLNRLTEAEALLRPLVAESPDDAAAHRWLAAIYYDLGANDLAIGHLQRLSELVPDDFSPRRLLGLMYRDFEQYEQAIEQYRQALDRSPPPSVREEILLELAQSLIAHRQYRPALETLESATPDADVLAMRAECLWSLGNDDEAWALVEQARSRYSQARSVLFLEARMLQADGQTEDALPLLRQILEHDVHDAECRYQLALALKKLGRADEHRREMERWKASKELAERRTELNIQAIREPRNAAVREELAEISRQFGQPELAAMWDRAAQACRQMDQRRPSEE